LPCVSSPFLIFFALYCVTKTKKSSGTKYRAKCSLIYYISGRGLRGTQTFWRLNYCGNWRWRYVYWIFLTRNCTVPLPSSLLERSTQLKLHMSHLFSVIAHAQKYSRCGYEIVHTRATRVEAKIFVLYFREKSFCEVTKITKSRKRSFSRNLSRKRNCSWKFVFISFFSFLATIKNHFSFQPYDRLRK
jgi:hypothetical protein